MSRESQSVVVVGGGVIGLCCAYYLSQAGRQVTLVEREPTPEGTCSTGNAGMIVPSHFIPLAAPGVIGQGLKWMLNPKSPFALTPRLDLELIRWIWLFSRHANARHVKNHEKLLRDLSLESRRLHVELAKSEDYPLIERGLLMLCQSEHGLADELEVAEAATRLGLKVSTFGREEISRYEPDCQVDVLGGVCFEQDCHLDPGDFIAGLRKRILANGGQIVTGKVNGFSISQGAVHGVTMESGETLDGDQIVLAGGVVTGELGHQLGLRLPMQGGKGYSFTLRDPRRLPRLCSLLKEGRVAVTPMGDTLRVAGTMVLGARGHEVDRKRLEGIVESFCRFYPEFEPADFVGVEPWVGLRPCSPDGLPYVGKAPAHDNVLVATGHAMMGLSLAPVTGYLISQLVGGEDLPPELESLDPARFG